MSTSRQASGSTGRTSCRCWANSPRWAGTRPRPRRQHRRRRRRACARAASPRRTGTELWTPGELALPDASSSLRSCNSDSVPWCGRAEGRHEAAARLRLRTASTRPAMPAATSAPSRKPAIDSTAYGPFCSRTKPRGACRRRAASTPRQPSSTAEGSQLQPAPCRTTPRHSAFWRSRNPRQGTETTGRLGRPMDGACKRAAQVDNRASPTSCTSRQWHQAQGGPHTRP